MTDLKSGSKILFVKK